MSLNENNKSNINDTEIIISKTLRFGVILSAITIVFGLLLLIITRNSGYSGSSFPTSPIQIIKGLFLLKPYAVILTGLLILILTPVFRVGISILTFLREKDYLYVAITTIVFFILIISFLLGKGE